MNKVSMTSLLLSLVLASPAVTTRSLSSPEISPALLPLINNKQGRSLWSPLFPQPLVVYSTLGQSGHRQSPRLAKVGFVGTCQQNSDCDSSRLEVCDVRLGECRPCWPRSLCGASVTQSSARPSSVTISTDPVTSTVTNASMSSTTTTTEATATTTFPTDPEKDYSEQTRSILSTPTQDHSTETTLFDA
ncbi:unnamed protein product [Notodromas monacha]|uniref:Uncharacterized protein n=1 Tax=Notodromas monacha TaxID=399045 RepID=A0A7R9BHD6_9CRUS|nr:unnamed protein product [Notodromas monacha]CAG0915526.1 unnamed protein product [Notodromas monacha]